MMIILKLVIQISILIRENGLIIFKFLKVFDVLTAKGSIDWSQVPDSGYVLDSSGKAIKETYFPKKGEIIDRYGPSDGTFTSPVIDGRPYSYDNRIGLYRI